MNTTTILDLIAAREAAAATARDELREQMTKLAGELAAIECELADLASTSQTLIKLIHDEVTAPEPTIISEPYAPRIGHSRRHRRTARIGSTVETADTAADTDFDMESSMSRRWAAHQ